MKNSIYEIRFARMDEYEQLRAFLKSFWGKNHILVTSKEIFDFQYLMDDRYNVIVGYNKETNEIDAFWGIISTSKYDKSLTSNGDCWGSVVKVRKDVKNKEIGSLTIKMLRFILSQNELRNFQHSGLGSQGRIFINPFCEIHGTLKHYYIANKNVEYRISENPIIRTFADVDYTVKKEDIVQLNCLPASSYKPHKTLVYIVNRYQKHPVYKYFLWSIYHGEQLLSIWVLRKISVDGLGNILRIVDVIGNIENIGCIGEQIQQQLLLENVEYVDFLNYGISEDSVRKIGFSELADDDKTIIPQYFEPFEKNNVPIHFALDSDNGYVVFKGDGDQDRPNKL